MPDRTQTLSVEREHVKRIAEAPMMLTEEQQFALRQSYEHVREQCRAALSQPEHQGDECDGTGILVACDCRPGWDGSGCHHELDCSGKVCPGCRRCQPPAPVLSDEERERIGSMADALDAALARGQLKSPVWKEDAAFLRNLASREHRGEEG